MSERIPRYSWNATTPSSDGEIGLPPWMTLSTATQNNYAQTSAQSFRLVPGYAPRGRSTGDPWGLAVESERQFIASVDQLLGTGVTATVVPFPAADGSATSLLVEYDGSDIPGNLRFAESYGPAIDGQDYAGSMWMRAVSATTPLRAGLEGTNVIVTPDGWNVFPSTITGDGVVGVGIQIQSAVADNSPFSVLLSGLAVEEIGKYPSSYKTGGDNRGADSVTLGAGGYMPQLMPHGYFDVEIVFAPYFAMGAQSTVGGMPLLFIPGGPAVNAIYFYGPVPHGDLFLVLSINGAGIALPVQGWSQNRVLTVRASHTPRGRSLTLLGTDGGPLSTSTDTPEIPIALPASASLFDNADCFALRSISFFGLN